MKINLLIVDDEEDLTWSIARGLKGTEPLGDILCASSGEKALEILADNHIDLLVTDVRMPGMGGIELVRAVDQIYPDVKIIVMSAHSRVEELDESHIDFEFIEKPFEIYELKTLINKSLQFNSK